MTDKPNDCTKCACRLDGMTAVYCYHKAFEHSHPGNGRVIKGYPVNPKWCPGMEKIDWLTILDAG